MDDVLLTADEAAAILRVKTDTIYRWVSQGRIPCVRLGRKITRFRRSDLDLFIRSHTANGDSMSDSEHSLDAARTLDAPAEEAQDAGL